MSNQHSNSEKLSNINFLNKIFYDHEMNRYGIIAMLVILVGCGGGIAIGLGALTDVYQITFLISSTMFSLAMILAVAPMKTIIYSSILALIIDVIIIVYNLVI